LRPAAATILSTILVGAPMRRLMQRLRFVGRITWGGTDCALYNQLAGSRGNVRARAMVWGAARFDQVDEHGACGPCVDGQLLRPHAHITRFLPRRKADIPGGGASQFAVLSTAGA
jgi:hypothetical protein